VTKRLLVVVLATVAEHHDGFALYDSGLSDWTRSKWGRIATSSGNWPKRYGLKVRVFDGVELV
jgi:hypothetical protein